MRATVAVNDGEVQRAVDAWLAATLLERRAVIVENPFAEVQLPDDVPLTRLAERALLLGQLPLRVAIVRLVRSQRPDAVLLLLTGPSTRTGCVPCWLTAAWASDSSWSSDAAKSEVDGINLAYRVDGPTPCAMGGDEPFARLRPHDVDPQMQALRDFRVLRFDTRGHGASDAPEGEYTIEQLGDDARALLDALGVERCHFVGLSMGGMIGQQLALTAPTRLLSLTLADTSSRYPASVLPVWSERVALVRAQGMEAVLQPTLERWFTARFREEQPHAVARIAAAIRATPVAGYIGCAHAIPASTSPHGWNRCTVQHWSWSVPRIRGRRSPWRKRSPRRSPAPHFMSSMLRRTCPTWSSRNASMHCWRLS